MEFCNGYLGEQSHILTREVKIKTNMSDFNTLSAKLPPPFSLSFPLLQYWDGQPVTYVCKKRAQPNEAGVIDQTEGEFYFAVAFEIVDEEARAKLAEQGVEIPTVEVKKSEEVVSGDEGGEEDTDGID